MNGGEFVGEWLVAVERDVLVCMSGFAIDVEVEGTIAIPNDGNVEHGDTTLYLFFHRPLDAGMYGIEVCEERLYVVVVDGSESIVGLPQPEHDDII